MDPASTSTYFRNTCKQILYSFNNFSNDKSEKKKSRISYWGVLVIQELILCWCVTEQQHCSKAGAFPEACILAKPWGTLVHASEDFVFSISDALTWASAAPSSPWCYVWVKRCSGLSLFFKIQEKFSSSTSVSSLILDTNVDLWFSGFLRASYSAFHMQEIHPKFLPTNLIKRTGGNNCRILCDF